MRRIARRTFAASLVSSPLLLVHLRPRALAAPAAAVEAQAVLSRTIDQAFAVLRDRTLAGGDRRARRIAALREIADRVFDWGEMARGSLGVHWRSLDTAKRERFVAIFRDILAAQYMDDIDRFEGSEKVTIHSAVAQGDEVLVRTTLLTASRERVPMDYAMRARQGRWMVVDVSIEGVSLVNHFRKTFANALANETIDQLIERLRRRLPGAT